MIDTTERLLAAMNRACGDFAARDEHLKWLRSSCATVDELAELYRLSPSRVRAITKGGPFFCGACGKVHYGACG